MGSQRDDIIQEIGDTVIRFKRAMQAYAFEMFGGLGLSPAQLGVLRIVHESQPTSHKALASSMQLTPGAISQLLEGLDEAGCIVRTPSESDRRICYLSVSRKGKQMLDSYSKLRTKLLNSAFSDLPIEDLQAFIRVQQTATTWLESQAKKTK